MFKIYIFRWGITEPGIIPDVLHYANIKLIPFEKCRELYAPDRNISKGMVCAGYDDGDKMGACVVRTF